MNGNGKPINYRQFLLGTARGTATFASNTSFVVPSHSGSAISLEAISFVNQEAGNGFLVAGDQMLCVIGIGRAVDYLGRTAGTGSGQFMPLAQASWKVDTVGQFNPPGRPGLTFDPGLRLAPSDDPCSIILLDLTSDVFATNAGLGAVLYGWELPTADLATFPRPDTAEAIL